jgi:hypothetical protein
LKGIIFPERGKRIISQFRPPLIINKRVYNVT